MKRFEPIFLYTTIFILICAIACRTALEDNSENFYYDYECTLVEKFRAGFDHGQSRKCFVIRSVLDTTLHREIREGYPTADMDFSDSNYYAREVGDTLFFDHIRKDLFFRIYK